jgi:hypothetical protein
MPLSIVVCQGWQNTVWNHHFLSFVPEFSEVQVRDLGIAWRAINNHKTCIPKSGSSTVDWGLANWPLANPSIPWWMGRWILHFQAQPYHKADCISHYVPFIPPIVSPLHPHKNWWFQPICRQLLSEIKCLSPSTRPLLQIRKPYAGRLRLAHSFPTCALFCRGNGSIRELLFVGKTRKIHRKHNHRRLFASGVPESFPECLYWQIETKQRKTPRFGW